MPFLYYISYELCTCLLKNMHYIGFCLSPKRSLLLDPDARCLFLFPNSSLSKCQWSFPQSETYLSTVLLPIHRSGPGDSRWAQEHPRSSHGCPGRPHNGHTELLFEVRDLWLTHAPLLWISLWGWKLFASLNFTPVPTRSLPEGCFSDFHQELPHLHYSLSSVPWHLLTSKPKLCEAWRLSQCG